jgi:hypothetical protein
MAAKDSSKPVCRLVHPRIDAAAVAVRHEDEQRPTRGIWSRCDRKEESGVNGKRRVRDPSGSVPMADRHMSSAFVQRFTSGDLPDFLIVGAMKAGTTSLYRWLGQQEEVFMPTRKEPNFFCDQPVWSKGLGWYAEQFSDALPAQIRGEASVKYTAPEHNAKAAGRIWETLPWARLIFVARHPIDRLRSHYRHQVRRGRERRPLSAALEQPNNEYIRYSMYDKCLQPYFALFPKEQIRVVRFEDLIDREASGWEAVLSHLGLVSRPCPPVAYNTSSKKTQFTRPMLWTWERGLLRRVDAVPHVVRAIGKRILIRRTGSGAHFLTESDQVDEALLLPVWNDISAFEERLGLDDPLWSRDFST